MNHEKIKKMFEDTPKKELIYDKMGIKKTTFNDILHQKTKLTVENLEKIAKYFGKTVGYFFDEPDASELRSEIIALKEINLIYYKDLEAANKKIELYERALNIAEANLGIPKEKSGGAAS